MADSEKLDLLDRQNRIIIQMIVDMNSQMAALRHQLLHRWAITDVTNDEGYDGQDEFEAQVNERFGELNKLYLNDSLDAKQAIIEAFKQASGMNKAVDDIINKAFEE